MTDNQQPDPIDAPISASSGRDGEREQTRAPHANPVADPKAAKKSANGSSGANFRVSQALYKTILTNLNVVLVLFIAGLVGWLVWYLSPLTQSNTTYNATAHETAVALVVNSLANANTTATATATNTGMASAVGTPNNLATNLNQRCDYLTPEYQQPFNDNIKRINQSLSGLYQQKRLANRYQLQTDSLWQQACEQNVSEEALGFALRTLANPDRLLQLQWLEQLPNRKNMDTTSVARLPANWLTQTNPWYGLAGCVYLPAAKSPTNPTGFVYVDNRSRIDDDSSANDPLTLLCNHPKLMPAQVTATLPNATDRVATATAQAGANGTIVTQTVNQAKEVLQNLKQQPITDPRYQIQSSLATNTALPVNLATMYSGLANIHSSQFDRQLLDAYQSYQQQQDKRTWWQKLTAPPMNTIDIDGSDVKIGYNMALTLDPNVQNRAQHVADCVTNSPNATVDCDTVLSPSLQNIANQMHESALVRSIGIAVIDVNTQGVLALASSDSDCYRVDNGDTMLSPKGCPTLWQKDWSKQNLMNHALYQAVYPGSTVKTVQALGLVRANPRFKNPATPEAQYLKQVMASSSTEKVANFLFCQSTTSAITLQRDAQGTCRGIAEFKKASNDMGWSVNCEATANQGKGSANCGFKDLLFGKPYNRDPMIQSRYFSGVLLTDGKQDFSPKQLNFSANQVASCVQGNGGRMNGACRRGGDDLNAVMNQVFGAGSARSTVLGTANSFANLLIADNGVKNRRGVHLVHDLWGVNQIPLRPKAWRGEVGGMAAIQAGDRLGATPVAISQSDARATLHLLSGTLLPGTGLGGGNGTAYSACQQAIGDCGWTRGVVIGKTGTPGFNYPTRSNGRIVYTPNVTMRMIADQCNNADIRSGKAKPSVTCYSRPYKWFVYGIKGQNGQWDKAVAVLVERNWTKAGLVDDPRDGINRAVQAGMVLAKQLYQEQ